MITDSALNHKRYNVRPLRSYLVLPGWLCLLVQNWFPHLLKHVQDRNQQPKHNQRSLSISNF